MRGVSHNERRARALASLDRVGLGGVKNVGSAAIDAIIETREKNLAFDSRQYPHIL